MRAFFIALLVLTAALPARAVDDPRQLVAVLPLDVRQATLDEPTRIALEESIRSIAGDVLSPRGYTVLTGDTTLAVLADNGVDAQKICDTSCALAAARELKARLFVSGTVARTEGQYAAFVRLFDVSGTQLASVSLEASTVRELRQDFERKAERFFGKAFGEAPPPPAPLRALPSPAPAPITVRPVAPAPAPSGGRVVRITAENPDDEYSVEIEHGDGVIACPRKLTFLVPCDLRSVPVGPVRVKVVRTEGGDEFTSNVNIQDASMQIVVHYTPATVRNVGLGLLVTGLAVGGVGLYVLLNEAEASLPSIVMTSLGGTAAYIGLIMTPVGASVAGGTVTTERFEPRVTLAPLPGGAALVALGSF